MKFNTILEETNILNETRINKFLEKYEQGVFNTPEVQKNPEKFIGTLTDQNKNPLTYREAVDILRDKGYSNITTDLSNLLRKGTQNHEVNTRAGEIEKERRRETRRRMKGGSSALSKGYI
jgi:hypothetical protein